MARLAIAKTEEQAPARRRIRIWQDRNGVWNLSDSAGLLGGHFLTARAAVLFVRLESCEDLVCVDGLLSLFDA